MTTENSLPPLPVALLLVDWQFAFTSVMPNGAAAVRRAILAARAAQLLGLPIAITEHVPHKLGTTLPEIREAAPNAPVFNKTAFSGVAADGLIEWLRERNVQHVLLTGLESPICIYQTAVQAMAEGFDVTLLADAVVERRAADRVHAFDTLCRAGAHILPVETVFYSLFSDSIHPQFREFTQLVKTFGD
ncbi:isochorismatase family protein [Cerasicoccus arenae]|uniref:isochorismatase family protein n=1 Tax=Cerasicoccus arenae TaxID=424488 RepID=UPI0019041F80|nr:isochorismatase family protein [Cerasicoccus arenae]MBK1858724.1 isochorismatase family protein [Cerasicoccus arenae]